MDIEYGTWVLSPLCIVDDVGDILLCGIALAVTLYLFYITERRKAAVGMRPVFAHRSNYTGRREMEIVLLGYFLINICEIFSLGGFLTNTRVLQVRLSAKTWLTCLVVFCDSDRSYYCDNMDIDAQCTNWISMAR